jgi:hypothetical protein
MPLSEWVVSVAFEGPVVLPPVLEPNDGDEEQDARSAERFQSGH